MENLQTLITEKAKDVTVQLSSLFEGLDLDESLKENLQVTFDTAVQTTAVQIAESVLKEATEQLEDQHAKEILDITENLQEKFNEEKTALVEQTELYLDEFLKEWKEENKLAIDYSLKAKLFDSIFESLSNVFVEHNLNVPTEQVDLMEEIQQENDELSEKLDSVLKEKKALETKLFEEQFKTKIKELTAHLTEQQIEKVITLQESIQLDEKAEQKLRTIINMVESTSKKDEDEDDESKKDDKEPEQPKQVDESLNYNTPGATEIPQVVNQTIAQYLKYAR